MTEKQTMKPFEFNFPAKRLAMFLYSQAGVGKSVSLCTLLKIPGIELCILPLEDNCLPAIQEGLRIHGITELRKGQLVIADMNNSAITSATTFVDQSDDSVYQAAVQRLMNFTGTDVATGETLKLGNALAWKNNRVLAIDGLTMLQFACQSRGKVKAASQNNDKDPRMAFYQGQDALLGYVYQILQRSKAHIVLLGHEAMSDEAQQSKHKSLKNVHPYLGTRSIVSPFMGRFNVVLYAKYSARLRKYVWSAQEDGVMTVVRNITTKDKTYDGFKVSLNQLPADFSFDGYDFFDKQLFEPVESEK